MLPRLRVLFEKPSVSDRSGAACLTAGEAERASGRTPLVFQARLPDSTKGGSCRASGQGRDTARLKGVTSAHSSRLSWAWVNRKSSPTGVRWFRLSAGRCAFSPPGHRIASSSCGVSPPRTGCQSSGLSQASEVVAPCRFVWKHMIYASLEWWLYTKAGMVCFSRHLLNERERERETRGAVCGAANPPR